MDVEQVIAILEERRRYNQSLADTLTPRNLLNERDVLAAQFGSQISREYVALIDALRSSTATKR